MKAIIMAGGKGTRLSPITECIPKPLVEVGGIPVLERIFSLLAANGINEAALTLRYLGKMIEDRYGASYGMGESVLSLRYFYEDQPLGTAGGVKNASSFLDSDEAFLVISGDAVTDTDLSEMLEAHKKNKAAVTVALSRAADPREYGTVLCDGNGKIIRFIEKPSWQHVLTDSVNTGIYIIEPSVMELVPQGCEYDFAADLFPQLAERGLGMYGYASDAHWCDIGSIPDYFAENMRITGGENAFSEDGGITVGEDCSIFGSIICGGVKIGRGCTVDGSVICQGCVLGDGASVGRGSVIGSGCVVSDGAQLGAGARLPSGSRVPAGVSGGAEFTAEEGGISLGSDLGQILSLGVAVAEAAGRGTRIGAVCGGGSAEALARKAFLCGLSAGGARPYDFGEGTPEMVSLAAARLGLDYSVWLGKREDGGGGISARFYDRDGLYPCRSFERGLYSALGSRPCGVCEGEIYQTEECDELDMLYRAALISCGREILEASPVARPDRITCTVSGKSESSAVIVCALSGLGFQVTDSEQADISVSPEGIIVTDMRGGVAVGADLWHVAAILALHDINTGCLHSAALPYIAPVSLERLLTEGNVTVARYTSCPPGDAERGARHEAGAVRWLCDPAFAAVRLCALLGCGESLDDLLSGIPEFFYAERHKSSDAAGKIAVVRGLGTPGAEGTVIERDGGRLRIIPESGEALRIVVEAQSEEAADELFAFSEREIETILSGERR